MNEQDTGAEVLFREKLKVEYAEGLGDACRGMVDFALGKLETKLDSETLDKLAGVTVKIGPRLTEGGGEAKADENIILLNSDKVKMTLQESENFLVQEGYFEPGERTRTLPDIKDQPWSTLVYELVHEFGHIIGGEIPTALSPTKYGKRAEYEAFCEAFAYWIFDQPIEPEAERKIMELGDNR